MKIKNLKLKIVFFGTPSFVTPVIDALKEHFDVVGVVTSPDHIEGRKKILTPSPVKAWAEKNNISVATPVKLKKDDLIFEIGNLKFEIPPVDLFVVAAYGKIIPQAILDIPKLGAINIHPSLLPKYRGASPIQAALLSGDSETGVTIIKMDAEMDHGPILAQETVTLSSDDTLNTLHTTMFEKAAQMLPSVIEKLVQGSSTPLEQDHKNATFCKHVTREDGFIDATNPPAKEQIDNMIRAYYPWPTAWVMLRIKNQEVRVKLLPEKMVQVEGKKAVSVKEFLNGYPEAREVIEKLI